MSAYISEGLLVHKAFLENVKLGRVPKVDSSHAKL